MGDGVETPGAGRRWFLGLLALAVVLRAAVFDPWSMHHPDEFSQYLEQAHRILVGYGYVPWEYRDFIRSWLMPLLLAGPMALGEALNTGGTLYLILPRVLVAAAGLIPVAAAWRIGSRYSLQHAIIAMTAIAVWTESVMFSVQTLTENLSVAAFLAGVALFELQGSTRRLAIVGALMALAGEFRFQFGPAIVGWSLIAARRERRVWLALAVGVLPVIVAGAGLDLATGHAPYSWIVNNYSLNIAAGRMKDIGGVSPWTFLQTLPQAWGMAVLLIPFLAAFAWRREPALIAAALVNLAVHQLVGHKEERYLLLTTQSLLIVAALGSVDLLSERMFGRRLAKPKAFSATATVMALWICVSATLAASPYYRLNFRYDESGTLLARTEAQRGDVCGLAVTGEVHWLYSPVLIEPRQPLFLIPEFETPQDWWRGVSTSHPGRVASAFNSMIAFEEAPPPPPPWRRERCAGQGAARVCLYRRPGACRLIPSSRPFLFQEFIRRNNM